MIHNETLPTQYYQFNQALVIVPFYAENGAEWVRKGLKWGGKGHEIPPISPKKGTKRTVLGLFTLLTNHLI